MLRTGLNIGVQFGEFRAEGTFILSAWQPVSVALLNAAVDAADGNSALRQHVSRALQIWPTPFESVVQEGITSGEFRADVGPTDVSTDPGDGDTERCSGDQPIAIQPKRASAAPATPERMPLICLP